MDDMKESIKEIKEDVKELLQRSAVHNELLRTHEARSLALQESIEIQRTEFQSRIKPIEEHVSVVGWILKISGGVLIVLAGQWLVRLLLR